MLGSSSRPDVRRRNASTAAAQPSSGKKSSKCGFGSDAYEAAKRPSWWTTSRTTAAAKAVETSARRRWASIRKDARLLLTELATGAVLHAAPWYG